MKVNYLFFLFVLRGLIPRPNLWFGFRAVLLIILLSIDNLHAQSFDMISTGDPILEDIRYLSIESGKSFLSFTPPLAPGELIYFLDSIEKSALSLPAREAYFRILKRLDPQANLSLSFGIFAFQININSTIEGRIKFNEKIDEHPQNPKINPALSIPLRVYFSNILQLYVEPSYTMRPNEYTLDTYDFNIPTGYFTYDESNPLKAFAAMGGDWWNFQIGRDRLFWGTGNTGSLTFSDNSQFFDFARVSLFSSVFKYSVIVSQLPLTLTDKTKTNSLFHPELEFVSGLSNNPANWPDNPDRIYESMHRYFYLHRFDLKLFNRISFAAMEGVMAGNSPVELRYLSPLILFHSLFAWENYNKWEHPYSGEGWGTGDMIGSFLSFEVNWNIYNNLACYFQVVVNQFSAPGELNMESYPNCLGYMAGINYSHSFDTWASVFFLEFVYTDPYLNLHSSPFNSFIQQNRYKQHYYLGYQRDTISLTMGTRFFKNDMIDFSGSFSWIASGEHNKYGLIWDWKKGEKALNEKTPTGIAENKYILSAGTQWKPYSWLILKAGITGIYSVNNNHIQGSSVIGGQSSVSVGLRF